MHTTQFAIRDPQVGLLSRFSLAASGAEGKGLVKVAGAIGPTEQAVREAGLAQELGYDAVLLSLGALKDAGVEELISHCARLRRLFRVVGFYLQPECGRPHLPYSFWRDSSRYRTLSRSRSRPSTGIRRSTWCAP